MYLDAPVYIWGVQCIYTAYLTGGVIAIHVGDWREFVRMRREHTRDTGAPKYAQYSAVPTVRQSAVYTA
jgi:hypothetical protein